MFAITGITGQVGGAVARTLLSRGVAVRAVARNAQKLEAWAARGCDTALADMADAAALGQAFQGAEAVFILLPPSFDPSPDFAEARAVIAAVRQALVIARPARIVALSTIGADAPYPNLLSQLALMEASLSDIDLPVTFLRAAWFIENAAWDVGDARAGRFRSYLQPLDRAIAMVSTEDVGRAAADLLGQKTQGTRVIELEGASRVSPDDLAEAFSTALGRPVRAEVVAREDWEELFRSHGMRNPMPRMQMLDGFNAGWIDFDARTSRKGTITLAEAITALVTPS